MQFYTVNICPFVEQFFRFITVDQMRFSFFKRMSIFSKRPINLHQWSSYTEVPVWPFDLLSISAPCWKNFKLTLSCYCCIALLLWPPFRDMIRERFKTARKFMRWCLSYQTISGHKIPIFTVSMLWWYSFNNKYTKCS